MFDCVLQIMLQTRMSNPNTIFSSTTIFEVNFSQTTITTRIVYNKGFIIKFSQTTITTRIVYNKGFIIKFSQTTITTRIVCNKGFIINLSTGIEYRRYVSVISPKSLLKIEKMNCDSKEILSYIQFL